LKNTEILTVTYVLYIAPKIARMMRFSAQEQEAQSMDAIARILAQIKKPTNGEKPLVLLALDGAQQFATTKKFCALHLQILVMAAQQKRFVEKQSRTLMVFSALEKNTPSNTKVKILERMV
jgi:hypoxanthine-guanine phosphoribosyltransferase